MGHGRYEQWCVLIIWMHHDDNVAVQFECLGVAALLIAAIAQIVIVLNDMFYAEPSGFLDLYCLCSYRPLE
jgi:hypothetical protein